MEWVAIKCRISEDEQRRGEGVLAQEDWGRDYSARTFPDIPVRVYTDNDISAADRETHRPDYERFCADIRAGMLAGDVIHVVTRDRNRITRDAAQWLDLVDDLFLPAGIEVIHTKYRGIMRVDDIATDFDAVLGRRDIRNLRQLTKDKHARLAKQGRPNGTRGLGFRNARNEAGEAVCVVVDEEADALRWAGEAVLAGWSWGSIADEWNRRNVPHPHSGSKPWDVTSVGRTLRRPSIAGLRVHHGQIAGQATWPAIIPEKKWRQIVAVLDQRPTSIGKDGRVRRIVRTRRRARRYLLTGGLAQCGLCPEPLVAQIRNGAPYYMCHPSTGGCARIGMLGDPLENFVVAEFLAEIDKPAFRAALEAGDPYAERRKEITQELTELDLQDAELGKLWAASKGNRNTAGWLAAQTELDRQRSALGAELAALPVEIPTVDVGSIREDWPDATLDERRALMRMFLRSVTVGPAVPGRKLHRPDGTVIEELIRHRVTIDWL